MHVMQSRREKILATLVEIGDAYRDLFPKKYEVLRSFVADARGMVRSQSVDGNMKWTLRMPQELVLFIDRALMKRGLIEPDESFWKRYDNVELLLKAFPDLGMQEKKSKALYIPPSKKEK